MLKSFWTPWSQDRWRGHGLGDGRLGYRLLHLGASPLVACDRAPDAPPRLRSPFINLMHRLPICSTRILGRRTAHFTTFLITYRVPRGFTQDSSTHASSANLQDPTAAGWRFEQVKGTPGGNCTIFKTVTSRTEDASTISDYFDVSSARLNAAWPVTIHASTSQSG